MYILTVDVTVRELIICKLCSPNIAEQANDIMLKLRQNIICLILTTSIEIATIQPFPWNLL